MGFSPDSFRLARSATEAVMPKYIGHHEGLFFEWSTVVDAPTTYGAPREEFEAY